jgi:hypothetical protein
MDFVHHLEFCCACGCLVSALDVHHHPDIDFDYIFLLLLVALSVYSESPQQGNPPDSLDSTLAAVCPNSSSDPLGVLAPVLPQSSVFGSVLPEVFGPVCQDGVFIASEWGV